VPATEIKLGEANLTLLGRAGGGRLESGYWFKEKTPEGERIINAQTLLANGNVRNVVVYQFNRSNDMVGLLMAEEGRLEDGSLVLAQVSANSISPHALRSLADAQPTANKPVEVNQHATLTLNTTLTPELMLARVLTPERMSMLNLWRYIDYLNENQLVNDRQVVAAWRKLI